MPGNGCQGTACHTSETSPLCVGRIARASVTVVAVLGTLGASGGCGSVLSTGARPPCSAMHAGVECWEFERGPALTCDASARASSATGNREGFRHVPGDPGQHRLIGPGTRAPSDADLRTFSEGAMPYARGLPGVRNAAVGWRQNKPELRIRVDHCTGPTLDEFAAHVRRWARGFSMEHLALPVVVQVSGQSGPRCRATDVACGPVQHAGEPSEPYGRDAERFPLYRYLAGPEEYLPLDQSPCSHDGDCLMDHDLCESWVEHFDADVVEGINARDLHGAFCGCVYRHCMWFRQP